MLIKPHIILGFSPSPASQGSQARPARPSAGRIIALCPSVNPDSGHGGGHAGRPGGTWGSGGRDRNGGLPARLTCRTTSHHQNVPFVPLHPNMPCSPPLLSEHERQSLAGPWGPHTLAECNPEFIIRADEGPPSGSTGS